MLSPQSESLMATFATRTDVTREHVDNLRAIINGSPVLVARFNEAVAQGHLRQLLPLTSVGAGGEYDPSARAMHLPLAKLTTPSQVGEVTFVLGHELQHGFNAEEIRRAAATLAREVRDVARSPGPVHDYTPALAGMLAANRRDEASAEIAGWNAIVSAVKAKNPNPTLGDVYDYGKADGRMKDFIVKSDDTLPATYTLKPNLTLNADMTMSPTPVNIEAMGQNYFDKAGDDARLGPSRNADYTNYYAAHWIGYMAERERHFNPPVAGVDPPRMTFDMTRLGLSEQLLEEKGIDLGAGNTGQQVYYDSSHAPPTAHLFQHTVDTHTHVNPVLAWLRQEHRQADAARDPAPRGERDPLVEKYLAALGAGDEEGMRAASIAFAESAQGQRIFAEAEQRVWDRQQRLPGRDHPLFGQALAQLERAGPEVGGYLDRCQMESIAGVLAHQAQVGRLPGIDEVSLGRDGQTLMATWRHPQHAVLDSYCEVDCLQASMQPLERSLQDLGLETRQQEDHALQREQQRQMETQQGFSR